MVVVCLVAWAGIAATMPAAAADAAVAAAAPAPAPVTPSPPASADAPRYTFSRPLDGGAAKPRGGLTRGAPVALDVQPSPAWQALQQALQQADVPIQERDRRAILAMAGAYRSSFDFIEVDTYVPPKKPIGPYQSWGTEKVYVDRDEPGFVSLVHILEMRIVDAKGATSEPVVMKHWRQDWAFEPATIVEYQGNDRWQSRTLAPEERRGAWVQTVYQVDESPRYASIGRWQHTASFSTWLSADTARPLPRREWSVRDDYQMLTGTNRHTVGPRGWTQEENNLKTVLDARGNIDPTRPYLAREYGIARYERLQDDGKSFFTEADGYYARTRTFWDRVRDTWSAAFTQQGSIALKGPVDKLGLFMPLFAQADRIDSGSAQSVDGDKAVIREALSAMGVYRAMP